MARKIRVTSICAPHTAYNGSEDYKAIAYSVADYIEGHIRKVLCRENDLIVLPEVYDRPGGIPRDRAKLYYAERGDIVLDRVKSLAKENKVNIVFSAIMDGGDGHMRNRQVFINRKGEEDGVYDKNHLVWEEHTESDVSFGESASLINMDFGKVGGVICYDLNFDELREQYVKLRPELLVFSSMYHGGYVSRNWAYTCRSYFVGCVQQRQGYIINPLGEVIAESNHYTDYLTAEINLDYVLAHIDYNWAKLEAMQEKYGHLVEIEVPKGLGCVMITSNSDNVSAMEMAKEFDIELLDDLFERGRRQRTEFFAK